jgi:hypothetical protein
MGERRLQVPQSLLEGTEDTSFRYASSSVFFHAVSIAEVWL